MALRLERVATTGNDRLDQVGRCGWGCSRKDVIGGGVTKVLKKKSVYGMCFSIAKISTIFGKTDHGFHFQFSNLQ